MYLNTITVIWVTTTARRIIVTTARRITVTTITTITTVTAVTAVTTVTTVTTIITVRRIIVICYWTSIACWVISSVVGSVITCSWWHVVWIEVSNVVITSIIIGLRVCFMNKYSFTVSEIFSSWIIFGNPFYNL